MSHVKSTYSTFHLLPRFIVPYDLHCYGFSIAAISIATRNQLNGMPCQEEIAKFDWILIEEYCTFDTLVGVDVGCVFVDFFIVHYNDT